MRSDRYKSDSFPIWVRNSPPHIAKPKQGTKKKSKKIRILDKDVLFLRKQEIICEIKEKRNLVGKLSKNSIFFSKKRDFLRKKWERKKRRARKKKNWNVLIEEIKEFFFFWEPEFFPFLEFQRWDQTTNVRCVNAIQSFPIRNK